jgi:hypothetical protein
MNRCVFNRASLEQAANELVRLKARITLKGNTTAASIAAYSDRPDGVVPYVETSAQPTPEDSGHGFPTLDSNAAPSVMGVLVLDGSFKELVNVEVLNITSGSMTAGVVTKRGASSTGVTENGNLSFSISCTGLDLDAAVADHSFDVIVEALRKTGA